MPSPGWVLTPCPASTLGLIPARLTYGNRRTPNTASHLLAAGAQSTPRPWTKTQIGFSKREARSPNGFSKREHRSPNGFSKREARLRTINNLAISFGFSKRELIHVLPWGVQRSRAL